MALIMLRFVPSIPTLVRVFLTNGCWTLSNAFSASIEMIIWFLTFLLLMWCMAFDWFAFIEPSLWIWDVGSFWYVVGFGRLKFCWEFLQPYSSKILANSFFFWWYLCLVLQFNIYTFNIFIFPRNSCFSSHLYEFLEREKSVWFLFVYPQNPYGVSFSNSHDRVKTHIIKSEVWNFL